MKYLSSVSIPDMRHFAHWRPTKKTRNITGSTLISQIKKIINMTAPVICSLNAITLAQCCTVQTFLLATACISTWPFATALQQLLTRDTDLWD